MNIRNELLAYETNDEELKVLLIKAASHIQKLEEQSIHDSWIINPDRTGGQFSDGELNRSDRL